MLNWVTNAPYGDWVSYALSASGQYLLGIETDSTTLYRSTDFGESWNVVPINAVGLPAVYFMGRCYLSADGNKIYITGGAGDYSQYFVLFSADAGTTWEVVKSGVEANDRAAISADGSSIVLAQGGGGGVRPVYYSSDFGQTWSASTLAFGADELVMSSDGLTVLHTRGGDIIYVSTDGGATFAAQASPSGMTNGLAVNSDASMVFAVAGYTPYVSSDFGATWTELGYIAASVIQCAVSYNGMTVAAIGGAMVYVSEDGGATWIEHGPPPDGGYASVSISGDGSQLLSRGGDYLYTAPSGADVGPTGPPDGSAQINPGESVTIESIFSDDVVSFPAFSRDSVAWSPTLKMFAGSVASDIYVSSNGRTWSLAATTHLPVGGPAIWGAGRFLITGQDGVLYSSTTGSTWVRETNINFGTDYPYLGNGATMYAMGWNGSVFVGSFEVNGALQILSSGYSVDGLTWVTSDFTFGMYSRSPITWSPTLGLFATAYEGKIYTSTNGKRWVPKPLATSATLGNVIWTGTNFIVVDSSGFVFASKDAKVWSKAPSTMQITGDMQLVRIGATIVGITEGYVFTTLNGDTWFEYSAPSVFTSATLTTDNIRGYAFSPSATTIIYLSSSRMFMPSPQLLATDDTVRIGRSFLRAPAMTVQAVGHENTNARLTMPMPRLIGYGMPHAEAYLTLQRRFTLKARGHSIVPNSFFGHMPTADVAGFSGAQGNVTAPHPMLTASGAVTLVGRARLRMPRALLNASGMGGGGGAAMLTLQHEFKLAAYSGAVATLVLHDGYAIMASGTRGGVGQARLKLPVFELVAAGSEQEVNSAYLMMPMLRKVPSGRAYLKMGRFVLRARGHAEVDATYEAYAVNLLDPIDQGASNEVRVNEITHYTNYPFKQIIAFNGDYYGVAEDGLHLLDGDTDAGEPIAWSFRTALTDFRQKKLKRIVSAYIGGRLVEGAEVTLVVGEKQDLTYTYVTPHSSQAQTYRVMFGKGVRTRYMALEVSDPLGKAVEVDSIEVENEVLERAI